MTQCCAKDEMCVVLIDLVFLLLIIAHWYVYNEIQGGVEFSPLGNLKKKIRKSKTAATFQDQTIN